MRLLAWFIPLLALPPLGQTARGADCVLRVELKGVIHPVTVDILDHAFAQAQAENCALILVRLDTPGGLVEAARQCVERLSRPPAPVAVWVAPTGARAASAGFFLLLAADKALMAPGTNTGAAHPVLLTGATPDEVLRKKIANDAAAWIRSIAARRGRNPALAEKAVLESRSFTDQEALQEKLIDAVAASEDEALAAAGGRSLAGARKLDYHYTVAQRIQSALSDPNLALALLVLGILGLYIEFTTPGIILPGVLGGILLLLGMSALAVLPWAWAGVGLLLLAIALFALELKIASHGVLGAGGTVAMVLGALMLVNGPIPELRVKLSTALGVSLPFAAISLALVYLVVRARLRPPETGEAGMVGRIARAVTGLDPEGQVLAHGELWQARAHERVEAGAPVRVESVQGLTLQVKAIPGGADDRNDQSVDSG